MAFNEADGITEMTQFEVERVDAVGSPANGTPFLLLKSLDVEKAKYSADQLQALYDKGHAMKGPKGQIDYPIDDDEDLHNAIHAVGRGKGSHTKIRAFIVRRAKEMGKTSEIPDEWAGAAKADDAVKDAPPADQESTPPATHDAPSAPDSIPDVSVGHPATSIGELPQDGKGSSLGAPNIDPDSAAGQTMENCPPNQPVPSGGDQQAHEDAQTQKAQSMTNPDQPGSDSWESHDVAIGKRTIAALEQVMGLVREFTNREEAEASGATKEIDVTREEMVALLADLGVKPKAAKSAEEKAAKKAKKAAKKEAASVARLDAIEKKLDEIEGTEQPHPILNGAAKSGSVFAELEVRVAKAAERRDVSGEMTARRQLTTAKMFAIENARERGELPSHSELSPNSVRILTRDYEIGDDPTIQGVG